MHRPFARLRTAALGAALALPPALLAQVATNACGYNPGNQYPVGNACNLAAFDKPAAFTATYNPNSCSSGNYDDAWGWFTATANYTYLTYDPNDNHRPLMHVFTGACGALVQVGCVDAGANGSNADLGIATVPGTDYMVRIQRRGTNDAMGGRFCAWSLPNDDPCGAIDLAVGTACSYGTYANTGATPTAGVPDPGCGTGAYNDAWFRFVAPANGLVTLRARVGTLGNPQFAVYHASSCSGTFSLVKCDESSGPGNAPFMTLTAMDIVPGETYYVRVWGYSGTTGTFDLCAFTAPAGGDCVYVLRMWDSMGNGWGNSTVSISVGGGPAQAYANTNADEEVAYIPVGLGQTVTLSYATGGSGNQNQIRYALQLGHGPLYMDGPTPGTGLRWAATANCVSPAPIPSDCLGGTAICNAQTISDNPSNTGMAVDLNRNSRGCLNANERQGLWYRFTISASGTLGFTIAPTVNSNDYDFALWGPYTTFSCPPDALPVRCNYSGYTGTTGLSASGTNPSEGAGGSKWSSLLPVTAGESYMLYVSNYTQSGLAFNLSWALTNGASLDCTLLPVELVSLEGVAADAGVRLSWVTAAEAGTDFFAVERMDEAGAFRGIGEVPASGYANSPTAYEFIDRQPLNGLNYYRLKMVDLDGSSKLSDMVAVVKRITGPAGLFPNPAEDWIAVPVDAADGPAVDLLVHDASGRLVLARHAAAPDGATDVRLPLNGLERGQYVLLVAGADGSARMAGRFVVR